MRYTFCETIAAYKWHIREVDDDSQPSYHGLPGRPATLCGLDAAWDIRCAITGAPLAEACSGCRDEYEAL